jgi:peptidyl-prolyl cis-trans isomerase C
MKNLLAVLCVVSLAIACKKATPAPPAAGAAPGAAAPPAASGQPLPGQPATGQPLPGQPAAVKPMPAQIPAVVARVNGEAIERWEFDNAVKRVEARAGAPVPPDKRDEVLRNVLDQLIAYHLLAQESRARKMDVPDSEVEARVAEIRKSFPDEKAFQQGIAAQGLTVDQVREQTRTQLQVSRIIDAEVASKIVVPDAEISAFYQQNLERFKQGDTVHASHILIGVPQNPTVDQKSQAKTKAQAVLKQVRGGGDFAAIARAESQDSGSAQAGGDLGFFPKGQMTPAFEEAAFKLKAGGLSPVVETPFGFHIIKVIERRGPRTTPLAEVGGQIKSFLEQGQRESKLEQFVEQVKAKSKVDILV